MSRKLDENSVMVGGIVPRFDNLNEVNEVNNRLALMFQRDVQWEQVTLELKWVKSLAENFSVFLKNFHWRQQKVKLPL